MMVLSTSASSGLITRSRSVSVLDVFLRAGVRPATPSICRFIAEHRGRFGVAPICRALSAHGCQIAPRTYWAWAKRAPSKRALSDLVITEVIAGLAA